ncbi:MAG: hypothetical protein P4L22_03960 [Candidatus Babeliales bacterium]|nr:hypothetical protein [Candidatus Babeliales bacterium]
MNIKIKQIILLKFFLVISNSNISAMGIEGLNGIPDLNKSPDMEFELTEPQKFELTEPQEEEKPYEHKDLKTNFPEIYKAASENNLNWHLQDGYFYLDDFFKGALGENKVFGGLNFEDYKIHLMPKKEDIQSTVLKLIKAAQEDDELLHLIADFKFITKFENYKFNPDYNMPIIIIYASSGKENAQRLLDKIYELFKDQEGLNKKPRWNEKVTSLIYFAQGNGDQKMSNRYSKLFEDGDYKGNGKVYFKADVTGKVVDYHLKNPAAQ